MHAMPVSSARQSAGFTLIELMVVMVLIGIIFSFAVLSLGGDDVAELMEQETRRLVTLLDMAGEEAVLSGEELAVYFTDAGYEFMVLRGERWQTITDDALLKAHTLPAGMQFRLEVDGEPPALGGSDDDDEEDSLTPQIYILSSGEMTPFSATLESSDSYIRYHLSATILGKLEWEAEDTF
jgi:general secretion pathway protein H